MQVPVTLGQADTMALFKDILDALSIAIMVIGAGGQIVFTNRAGNDILSDGNYVRLAVGAANGTRTIIAPFALSNAFERVCKGASTSCIGVPLNGANGKQSAGYVLPIAAQVSNQFECQNYCLFLVTQRDRPQPIVIEVLRTMFDLTSSEARVAALIAKGDGPQTIAQTLNVTINTVRTHLKNTFSKTSAKDQTSLGALVNGLIAPIS